MTTTSEIDEATIGLVGEHEPEVPLAAQSGCAPATEQSDRVLHGDIVARRVRPRRYLIDGQHLVDITMHRHTPPRGEPIWTACASLETPAGLLQWCASVSENEVARRLATVGARAPANRRRTRQRGSSAGGAQTAAFRRVVSDIRRTLDTPQAQAAVAAVSSIPYVGPVVQGLRAATTLVDNVANGDQRARANLVRIQGAARAGNPRAQQAIRVVDQVIRGQRQIAADRAQGAQRRRRTSAEEDLAWQNADERWNEYRARRARDGAPAPEPLIPPPPRG